MTTAVHLDFKGQGPGRCFSLSGQPCWVCGTQQSSNLVGSVYPALELGPVWPQSCMPRGTHRSSSLLALGWGWGWETGRQGTGRGWGAQSHREQLAPPLAGRG